MDCTEATEAAETELTLRAEAEATLAIELTDCAARSAECLTQLSRRTATDWTLALAAEAEAA